ncbi:MAG TPA: tetratricopeptide repeat protein, partial [Nannocystaceae bacterium]|nr:tetratricopeptide repeat protein [Nannocystaceae bacterium]
LRTQARTACTSARTQDDEYRRAASVCLDDARLELVALADRLAHGAPIAMAGALHHAIALPDVLGCADARRLALAQPSARAPERTREARELFARARDAQTALAFGPPPTELATTIATAIADAERSTALALADGDRGLAAAAAIVHARLLVRRGEGTAADAVLRRAVEHAIAIDDPVLRLHAMIVQVYVIGLDRDRADEAYLLGEQVRTLIDAGGAELSRAQLDNNLGTVAARDRRDRTSDAETFHRAALAGFAAQLGDGHPDTLASRVNLASALAQANRPDDALAELHVALAPALAVWGEQHPSTARLFGVLGNTELRAGRLAEAESWMRRALAVQERAFGPDDAEVASALYNLAMVLRRNRDPGGAITALRRGLAIRERLVGREAAELIAWLVALGEAELEHGAPDRAEPELRRALSLCETDGAPAKDFARVRAALARAVAPRDRNEAKVLASAARATYVELRDDAARDRMDALLAELAP